MAQRLSRDRAGTRAGAGRSKLLVWLVCWDEQGAAERAAALAGAGFRVIRWGLGARKPSASSSTPPSAVVIDLSRLPSHGREVALALRGTRATRDVPLVFAGGLRAKVDATRAIFPEGAFTSWDMVGTAVRDAVSAPVPRAAASPSAAAGYSGTPLPKKLGIKGGVTVALLNEPAGFRETLGEVPEGVMFTTVPGKRADLTVLFVRSAPELRREAPRARRLMGRSGLWIAWPKRASGLAPDLSEDLVRRVGLDTGVVDVKVCAIDGTWSGLKFLERRKP